MSVPVVEWVGLAQPIQKTLAGSVVVTVNV